MNQHMTCYNNIYPFRVLQEVFKTIKFEPITILDGSNDSEKSTVLNIIANKSGLRRNTKYNRSAFMEGHTDLCTYYIEKRPDLENLIRQGVTVWFMLRVFIFTGVFSLIIPLRNF